MTPRGSSVASRRGSGAVRLLVTLVLLCGCTADATPAPQPAQRPGGTQPGSAVTMTVYLRDAGAETAHLVPVKRELRLGDDLPEVLVREIVGGPTEWEVEARAVVPADTEVSSVRVADGVATVDLSSVPRATEPRPSDGVLALAAVTNTLTELPTVDAVRLEVDGASATEIGSPELLVRDETLIGAPAEDADPAIDLDGFDAAPQEVAGSADGAAEVLDLRVTERLMHTRYTIELDADDTIPAARAWHADGALHVVLTDARLTSRDGFGEPTLGPGGPSGPAAGAVGRDGADLTLDLPAPDDARFRLRALPNPPRIVLDVSKASTP